MIHTIHNHYYKIILKLKNLKIFAPANYWCILNKSAGKIHKNIGSDKNVQKHWRIQKTLAPTQNIGTFRKPWRRHKTLAQTERLKNCLTVRLGRICSS
jgi:hypothetical protein